MSRYSDATLRRLGLAVCWVSILAAPVVMAMMAIAGVLDQVLENFALVNVVTGLCYGVLGLVLVNAEPRNRLVWFFILVGFVASGHELINGVVELLAADQGVHAEEIDTSGWLPGVHWLTAVSYSSWVINFFGLPTIGLLIAPDGHVLSRRWTPVVAVAGVGIVGQWLVAASGWPLRSLEDGDLDGWLDAVDGLSFVGLLAVFVAALISLPIRYRRSDSAMRRRLRWVLLGSAMYVVWLVLIVIEPFENADLILLVWYPVLPICYGLAIWRDQLFDVDVVISRTLLFGFLAAFIGAVYVGVVFGIGALFGQGGGGSQGLALFATVVVAFLFHPVRQRLERAANRLVYGPRATPYEVLSGVSGRLAQIESSEGLLDRMVALVAEGTGAEQAVVWRWADGGYEPLAAWPPDTSTERSDGEVVVPIERAGEVLGALSIVKARGDVVSPIERRLLDDLAGSAGLVLERARLNAALSDQAVALERSRRRLIDAQDEERRRIEGQLSVSTQEQLSHLSGGLSSGVELARSEGADPIAEQLSALIDETHTARDEIDALVRGVYPPVLEADGLAAAVESVATTVPVPVEVYASGVWRFDLDTELAVYFCVAEALTNAAKHAHATAVTVSLEELDGKLVFEVRDDGVGFDPTETNGSSTGLAGLSDRLDAVGGTLDVRSAPGAGTRVVGAVQAVHPAGGGEPVSVG